MNLHKHIKNVLQQDHKFCKNGRLFKNTIVEYALRLDPQLLKLLLSDDITKKFFFTEVDGITVFDKIKLQQFVSNKQFLADNYTVFKNRIGLTANRKYLSQAYEVVLDFPYKDCVLEGGQTKEDQKTNEIFWNETLAADEIDRLFDPKVLINWKRYNKNGKQEVKQIERDNKQTIKENLIIKGNNLLALHSLKEQFAGKIKLIYIDPPYNTGNDGFKYNDSFNHSTWLTFIKNRLEIAKNLLKDDGVIFISCDDNEQAYLKVLCDEIFGRDNFIANLIWRSKGGYGTDDKYVAVETEYILMISKNKLNLNLNRENYELENYNLKDKHFKERGHYKLNKLDRKSLGYIESLDYEIKHDNLVAIPGGSKIENNKKIWRWRWSKSKVEEGIKNDFIVLKKNEKEIVNAYYKIYEYVDNSNNKLVRSKAYSNILEGFTSSTGTNELNKFLGDNTFNYPKPTTLIKRILKIATDKNDLVLDFFAGSGTTGHATLTLNKEDGGNRKFILVEQLDEHIDICIERNQKVLARENIDDSFICCELAKNNARYVDKVQEAEDDTLSCLWDKINRIPYIGYKINPEDRDKHIKEFQKLNIEDKKKCLISLLNKNHLYVNYSEMEDQDNQIAIENQKLTREFYKENTQ